MIKDSIHAKHHFPFRMQIKNPPNPFFFFFTFRFSLISNNLQIWRPFGLIIALIQARLDFLYPSNLFKGDVI